jgi:hypothetical protein
MKRLMEALAELPDHPVYVALIFVVGAVAMVAFPFITT